MRFYPRVYLTTATAVFKYSECCGWLQNVHLKKIHGFGTFKIFWTRRDFLKNKFRVSSMRFLYGVLLTTKLVYFNFDDLFPFISHA